MSELLGREHLARRQSRLAARMRQLDRLVDDLLRDRLALLGIQHRLGDKPVTALNVYVALLAVSRYERFRILE